MIFLGTPGMKEFLKRKHSKILEEHPKDWHEVITKETWDEYDEWKQTDDTKHNHRDMANSIPAACDFSVCKTHSKGVQKEIDLTESQIEHEKEVKRWYLAKMMM